MDNVKEDSHDNEPVITAIPLLAPAEGVPKIIGDEASFENALRDLAKVLAHLQLMRREHLVLNLAHVHISFRLNAMVVVCI
jgi:hypothetical protein